MNKEPMTPENLIAVARQSWAQRSPAPLGEASCKIPFILLPLILRQALQVQKGAVVQKATVKVTFHGRTIHILWVGGIPLLTKRKRIQGIAAYSVMSRRSLVGIAVRAG